MVANGNITPSRVVIIDSSQPANMALQATSATANSLYGVAQAGTRNTPLAGLDTGYAASQGDNLTVFTVGDLCQAEAGASTSAGVLLTTNGSGQVIQASSGNYTIGESIDSCTAAGQYIQIRVQPGRAP